VPTSINDRGALFRSVGRKVLSDLERNDGLVSGENRSVQSATMKAINIAAPRIKPSEIRAVVPIMIRSCLIETLPG
jgi:hypothetical protein